MTQGLCFAAAINFFATLYVYEPGGFAWKTTAAATFLVTLMALVRKGTP
jgi:hypothetical protein